MADLRSSNYETVTCERVVRVVTRAENAAAQCSARAENAPVFESSQATQLPCSQRSSQSERFHSLTVNLTAPAHVVPPTAASAPSAPPASVPAAAPASFLCLLEKRQKGHSKHSPTVAPLQLQVAPSAAVLQPAGLVCAPAEDVEASAQSAEELGERAQLAEGQLDLAELQARVVGSQLQLLRGMLAEREEQVRAVMAELAGMRARVVRARNVAEQSPRGISRSRSAAQGRCAGGCAAGADAGETGAGAGGSICRRRGTGENAGIARGNQGTRNGYTGRASFSVPTSLMSSRRASTDRRPAEASQALAEIHSSAAAAGAAAAVATGAGGGDGEASACASECLEAAAELQQVEMSVASTEAWLWEVEAAAAEARVVFLQAEEEAAAAAAAAVGAAGAAGAAGEGGAAAAGEQDGRTMHSGGFRHELALTEKAFTEELYKRLAQLQADLIEAGEGERVLQGILQGLEGSKGTVGKLLLTGMDGGSKWEGEVGGEGGFAGEEGDGRGEVEVKEQKGLSFWDRINGDSILKGSVEEIEKSRQGKQNNITSDSLGQYWADRNGADGIAADRNGVDRDWIDREDCVKDVKNLWGSCGAKSTLVQSQQQVLLQQKEQKEKQAQQQHQQQHQQQQKQRATNKVWDAGVHVNGQEDNEEALILQQALEYLRKQQVPAVAC